MGEKLQKEVRALRYIESLGSLGMKFDLNRMRAVMAALGNPQDLYPSIHIAGTNGKGSVAAMMASVLRETGRSVGMYTSPHLERVNERFQIKGRLISDKELSPLVRRVRSAVRRSAVKLTQFEFLTALAFLWFADKKIDVAVIETGLGGRLDATNVISRKLISVITNIDLEHREWLGRSKVKIAYEKAGIIRPGVPVVTGATGTALAVIRRVARQKGSSLTFNLVAETRLKVRLDPFSFPLCGAHQKKNAALALQALKLLPPQLKPSKAQIVEGLRKVRWPGRFECFLIKGAAGKRLIVLDGAHNPAAAKALAAALRSERIGKVDLLLGTLRDKDAQGIAQPLAPLVERCITVPVPSERTSDPAQLARLPAWRGRARAARRWEEGWRRIKSFPSTRAVLVTGSLYLVGAVRKKLRSERP